MKIEKLTENKIRITFNNYFLQKNNIDIHSFMSNSIESQNLFLNILDKAENEIGFITDNYNLLVDTIALKDGTYIITVTRIKKGNYKSVRVQAHKKDLSQINQNIIYKFTNFDDFCNFENFLFKSIPDFIDYFSNCNYLYKYNDFFFFILENAPTESLVKLSTIISEFAIPIPYSELIVQKIKEYGTLVTENAINK